MGYRTEFIWTAWKNRGRDECREEVVKRLAWLRKVAEQQALSATEQDRELAAKINWGVVRELEEPEDQRWYDYHEDMLAFSKLFPEYVFELEGHGEEYDDLWRKYYYQGSWLGDSATITYPELDFWGLVNQVEKDKAWKKEIGASND